jgi:hypothetical protein
MIILHNFAHTRHVQTLQTAAITASSPPMSNVRQSFSSTVGRNMGLSAGFFGPDPTATYSEGEDMSKTVSYSLGSMSVQDYSKENHINKQLTINHLTMEETMKRDAAAKNFTDAGLNSYEVSFAELFKIPDDGTGERSKTKPTTFRCFEIALQAERDTQNDECTKDANVNTVSLTTNVRQIIKVKAPPLPKPDKE